MPVPRMIFPHGYDRAGSPERRPSSIGETIPWFFSASAGKTADPQHLQPVGPNASDNMKAAAQLELIRRTTPRKVRKSPSEVAREVTRSTKSSTKSKRRPRTESAAEIEEQHQEASWLPSSSGAAPDGTRSSAAAEQQTPGLVGLPPPWWIDEPPLPLEPPPPLEQSGFPRSEWARLGGVAFEEALRGRHVHGGASPIALLDARWLVDLHR